MSYRQENQGTDSVETVKDLIQKNKKALALGVAVAVTLGTAGLLYYLYDNDDDDDTYISRSHTTILYGRSYYYGKGSSYHTGTWSKSRGYSGSSYSTSRAGGISA